MVSDDVGGRVDHGSKSDSPASPEGADHSSLLMGSNFVRTAPWGALRSPPRGRSSNCPGGGAPGEPVDARPLDKPARTKGRGKEQDPLPTMPPQSPAPRRHRSDREPSWDSEARLLAYGLEADKPRVRNDETPERIDSKGRTPRPGVSGSRNG